MIKKPELLMPAGDINTLKTAIRYGADACYIGGENFSLRAKAVNFSDNEIKNAITYAHKNNIKIYITANIYANNDDIEDAKMYFCFLNEIKPDGVLISDFGLFELAKNILKDIPIHISTQANTTNYLSVKAYKDLGVKRVVVARELSLKEIKKIKEENKDIEIESFVHGAMCISYSGRCLLSAIMTERSANRGLCTHPCRWKYILKDKMYFLEEEKRKNIYYPVFENDRGTYIFNSKDLCMISHIDDLVKAGIDSFKIEGRMKTELYTATVARAYRKAIDDYFENESIYKKNIQLYEEEMKKLTYREYTTGFYYGNDNKDMQIYENNTYVCGAKYYGTIYDIKDGYVYIEQKNKFSIEDTLQIMKKDLINLDVKVIEMRDAISDEKIESCPHSKQKIKVKFDKNAEIGDIIRSK